MADRAPSSRGLRDEAGVGPNPRQARRLVPLKELDHFKVADGEPDIRGWSVFTATGREIGVIDDLLVDTDMGEVVMVDVDLKRDDRHTLAPIRAAWIDRPNRRVVLNTSMFDVDDDIPALRRANEPLEAESVRRFNERYERAYGADGFDEDRDITIRRANDDFRIARSVPPAPATSATSTTSATPPTTARAGTIDDRSSDRPVERAAERTADRAARTADRVEDSTANALGSTEPQVEERRRYVRYGPSRADIAVEQVVTRPRDVDAADLSPAETERLRQQSGDITTDARDTLVNPPPTEERR